jgi:UDP-glucose 4-epimerase
MREKHEHSVVTGGAGFIGSHLVERLIAEGNSVTVIDDYSSGDKRWVPEEAEVVTGDLRDPAVIDDVLTPAVDTVFHLAASKAVNTDHPREQFEMNTEMTYTVLQAMDRNEIDQLVYTSSSTVYGEAPRPTPEDHAPLEPISVYGASKLADESLCSAYAHSHGIQSYLFRFANIVGPRLQGAVVPDFIEKLNKDPQRLQILGNGRQEKSYMYISDCIDAMLTVLENLDDPINTFNLGTQTTTSVNQIADIVSDELGVDPEYEYTGGDRGWTGDVPKIGTSQPA